MAFRRELQEYQSGLKQLAGSQLGGKEERFESDIGLTQAKEGTDIGKAQFQASQAAGRALRSLTAGEGITVGSGPVIGTVLKAGQKYATYRAGQLAQGTSRWKLLQAQRFRKANPSTEETSLGDEPDPQLSVVERGVGKVGKFFSGLKNKPQPPSEEATPSDPSVQRAATQETQGAAEEAAQPVASESSAFDVGTTTPQGPASVMKSFREASGEGGFDDTPLQVPKTLTQGIGKTEEEAAQAATKGLSQEAEDISKSTAGEVEDLVPEFSEAAEGFSGIGGLLGDLIPFIGIGTAIAGLAEGIKGAVDVDKEASDDPYASIRGKIATAEGKIKTLNNTISGDQFSQKIGAGPVKFGSLSVPVPDTSKMMGGSSHF